MAQVTLNQFRARQFGTTVPYGNTTTLRYLLKTGAAGGAIGADSSAALAEGDVVDLGPLPAGFSLDDCQVIVSTAMTAAVTGSLGFVYEDGADSAEVPQDAGYFGAGLVLNTAGRLRAATAKPPVLLPKPARLILTLAGANNAKASQIDVLIQGELIGPR